MTSPTGPLTTKLRLAIELISVATALSFILSALILFTIFRIWNLDFFALASVSDVVMGGAFILVLTLGLTLLLFVSGSAALLIRERNPWIFAFFGLFIMPGVGYALLLAASKAGYADVGWIRVYRRYTDAGIYVLAGVAGVALLLSRPAEVYEKAKSRVRKMGHPIRIFVGIFISLILIVIFNLANLGFAGIYTFPTVTQQAAYGCPNGQAHIMWVGDRSVVIRCGARFRVLLDRGGLLIEKVNDRKILPGSDSYLVPVA